MSNRKAIRFGVKSSTQAVSGTWRLDTQAKGEVYLQKRQPQGIAKYSFHRSGICHYKFLKPDNKNSEVYKWTRPDVPPVGELQAAFIARIFIPNMSLSFPIIESNLNDKITWISPSFKGNATCFEILFTPENLGTLKSLVTIETILFHHRMASGYACVLRTYPVKIKHPNFRSPATNNSVFSDIIVSEKNPFGIGFPLRMTFNKKPADKQILDIFDVGAYLEPKVLPAR